MPPPVLVPHAAPASCRLPSAVRGPLTVHVRASGPQGLRKPGGIVPPPVLSRTPHGRRHPCRLPHNADPPRKVRTTSCCRAHPRVPRCSLAPARAGWSSADKRSRHGGRRSVGGRRSSAGRTKRPSMRSQGPEGAAMNSLTHVQPIPREAGRMPADFGVLGLRGSKPAGCRPVRRAWASLRFRRAGPRPEERSRQDAGAASAPAALRLGVLAVPARRPLA